MRSVVIGLVLGLSMSAASHAQVVLRSSVLPNSRAATVGQPVTVFATMLNSGDAELTNCSVALAGSDPYTFSYQRTDATNAPVGTADTPFSIAAGANQSLVLSFTPTAAASGDEVRLTYACDGATAPNVPGVNTVFLTASAAPTPDIVPILATPSGDGVLRFDTIGQVRAMSAAAVNIGETAQIDVSATAPFLPNAVSLRVCETNPANGQCLAPRADSVRVNFAQNETRTFAVFADAADNAGIPNLPAVSRIYLLFNGVPASPDISAPQGVFPASPPIYGATSSAAIAPGPAAPADFRGVYRGLVNGEPGVVIAYGVSELLVGTNTPSADGFVTSPAQSTGNSVAGLAVGYANGETVAAAGIGNADASYSSRAFIRGSYSAIADSTAYDYQAVWDPISTQVLYADDTPAGTWDIRYDGASIGTMTVNGETAAISGSVTWPTADGAQSVTCDLGGVVGGGGALGLNTSGLLLSTSTCGPNYFVRGYYEDRADGRYLTGHAAKQGSNDGTPDFMLLEFVRQ